MKRKSYVDMSGNVIDHSFESKKIFLKAFFIFGTIVPVVIIGFIIYTIVDNHKCNNIYGNIKTATLKYIDDKGKKPNYEGESETINIDKLYSGGYLNSANTNNLICSGKVKVTLYKNKLVYTLDVNNCGYCSVNKRYGSWSNELNYYPTNKSIVDVIPYYNYYERQVSVTDWSKEYLDEELENEKSEYGVKLPTEEGMEGMPEIPKEGNIIEVQTSKSIEYSYTDKQWLWYDIVGDYSDFSSEKPKGYLNKDDSVEMYSEWSDFSLNYPEEKSYRNIEQVTGYKFYYEKDGKKHYANKGKYTAEEDVNQEKYNQKDDDTSILYRYRDTMWRWYNGEKRSYSSYSSTPLEYYPYRDDETEINTSYSSWSEESAIDYTNQTYRKEQSRAKTKFRYVYEILSLQALDEEVNRNKFEKITGMSISDFSNLEDYKLEVTYKFKYRKR